jgi:hypothetical protein
MAHGSHNQPQLSAGPISQHLPGTPGTAADDDLTAAASFSPAVQIVAVVSLPDGGLALARVPLCGCGTRGCGNAGVQFGKPMPADDLPALAGLLRGLPWTEAVASRSDVLRGDGLAALPVRRFTGRAKVVFHGTRVQDGVRVPVTRVL